MGKDLTQIEGQQFRELKDGTKASGFVRGGQNKPPRECHNCIWMGFASCGHPVVMADPELESTKGKNNDFDRVPVDADDCCDNMQSRGNVLIYVVRHGATVTDDQGKHGGWQDDKLNENGRQEARMAAKYLEGVEFKQVFCSDMSRSVETAKIVSGRDGTKDKQLRPWDVGIFTGKDHDLYAKQFDEYVKHPSREIPDGESLAQFATRMHKVITKYIEVARKEGAPILLVCHSRNLSQYKKQIEGEDEFGPAEDFDKVDEGGIMTILEQKDGDKTELKVEIVWNRGDEGYLDFAS